MLNERILNRCYTKPRQRYSQKLSDGLIERFYWIDFYSEPNVYDRIIRSLRTEMRR